ncbi:glycerol-3-phosphate 1-O-acyltransferase PlsY [Dissulfurirhabdus thermomarina]|uniref:Glycerol-3-phosphate acyltransferase n=1 Tax=Dissulfurirhabdus thermomarina TaxID=1765737 RepID=A0A6N9TTJ0_DISTH|nr:glycerol-3-phosphate 1-O-acyltransferase PlsY [Dissulfurirhabdus thermomarina]NDY43413.1 glycerol-3-phosphate 1-O-acyltransferase PlsY [Dissulfurirhabdus thermomarina]NMX22354.1 glycerol-3-phosphate 1-O-acyltransferase PlsY [Dissulfurirhabdus thermomarina]
MVQVIWPAAAYLLGAVPFGLLVARRFGQDPRRSGSGNIGATNVTRVLGRRWGALTLLLDAGKGALPVLGCRWALAGEPSAGWWVAATGLAAVVGHCYPVYLRFRGGKGVATAAGALGAVCPAALGVAAAAFALVAGASGYVSAGSLAAAALMPALAAVLCPAAPVLALAWGAAVLVWVRHADNIRRLLRGEEKGWRRRG